jgi:hypothetical protein
LFYEENQECIGIWQGAVDNVNPAINYKLTYTQEDTGEPENYERIAGIVLENDRGHRYAAVWNDHPVDIEKMRLWTKTYPVEEQPESGSENRSEADTEMQLAGQSESESENRPEADTEMQLAGQSESELESGPKAAAEMQLAGQPESESENRPKTNVEMQSAEKSECKAEADTEMQLAGQSECEPDENTSKIQCTRIRREEIARLPRCEWKLANNNFLLHGCYNYHHLVLLEEDGRFYLGVPGLYHPKEARAAAAFGFPDFVRAEELNMATEEDAEDQFGYWCRQVRRPVNAG